MRMKAGLYCVLAVIVATASASAIGAANAADIVVRVPVYAGEPRVPRVKPASTVKRYPFGVLREDYTPYGMAGVPDRLYFNRIERVRVARHRHLVRAAY